MSINKIFRAGSHVSAAGESVTITDADLIKCCDSYSKEKHEAPLVVGHPTENGPAYGWVSSLQTKDGALFAESSQVDENFSEMVNKGYFKKVSASFYKPEAKINPVPGVWYLRHVGFLGAMPPAVKGLGNATFNEEEGESVTVDLNEEWIIDVKTEETKIKAVEKVNSAQEVTITDYKEHERILDQKTVELQELFKRLRHEKNDFEVKKRVYSGKINSETADEVVAFLDAVSESDEVCFGEVKKGIGEWFLGYIDNNQVVSKQVVVLGESVNGEEVKEKSVSELTKDIEKIVRERNIPYYKALKEAKGL